MVSFWLHRFFYTTSRYSTVIHHFLSEGIAYLGWGVGPIQATDSKADIRQRIEERHHETPKRLPNIVGMLVRFSCDVRIGDHFVTYDPPRRMYHVGSVRSDVRHQVMPFPDLATGDELEGEAYVRDVDWTCAVERDALSQPSRNALNPQLSHWRIAQHAAEEIRRMCS